MKIEQTRFDEIFERMFGGFIATPDDSILMLASGTAAWWSVLGVEPDAAAPAIKNAFRALAKTHHPDAGGDPADFKRLRAAYEQGMAVAQKGQIR